MSEFYHIFEDDTQHIVPARSLPEEIRDVAKEGVIHLRELKINSIRCLIEENSAILKLFEEKTLEDLKSRLRSAPANSPASRLASIITTSLFGG